jgi:hypothetical protein
MANWWDAPVTQGFGQNGERGVDLGVSYHTPISTLDTGTVSEASCGHPWGCEVGIDTSLPGHGSVIEYFLHLDQLLVGKGQQVQAGQEIGLSGGQLGYGNQPNDPSVSTGPHLEVGYFSGSFWGPSFDPLSVVRQGPGQGGPANNPGICNVPVAGGVICGPYNAGQAIGSGQVPSLPGLPSINFDPWGGFQQAIGGTASSFGSWVHDRVVPFAGANLIALAVAAAVILILFGTGSDGGSSKPQIIPVPV